MHEPLLPKGITLRMKTGPGRCGQIYGRVRQRAGVIIYRVQSHGGHSYYPIYELEVVAHESYTDLWDKLKRVCSAIFAIFVISTSIGPGVEQVTSSRVGQLAIYGL
jgi:hypothetical protein